LNWLPEGWSHPTEIELSTGHHLRPIRAADVDLDMPAVMGSRERLWSIYGSAWGWPPATLTREQDQEDLQHHADEIEAHKSFNYALFDRDETELIGCVYIDPPTSPDVDAEISWWVRNEYVGTAVEQALNELIPRWITEDWPLRRPGFGPPVTGNPDSGGEYPQTPLH
jgi:RimJ/RimL family protein N-acetyltransferase